MGDFMFILVLTSAMVFIINCLWRSYKCIREAKYEKAVIYCIVAIIVFVVVDTSKAMEMNRILFNL